MADADTQPLKVGGVAQRTHDVPEPVVTAVTAIALESRDTRRQVKFVVSDENLGWGQLEEPGHGADGLAAAVHEGVRNEQANVVSSDREAGRLAVKAALGSQCAAVAAQQVVHKVGAGIMPGA